MVARMRGNTPSFYNNVSRYSITAMDDRFPSSSCKRFKAIVFCFFTVSTARSNSWAISEGFFPSSVMRQIFLHCGGRWSIEFNS